MSSIRLGVYQHFKGELYWTLYEAVNAITNEKVIVYMDSKQKVWVRDVANFTGTVEVDGKQVPRFSPVKVEIGEEEGTNEA